MIKRKLTFTNGISIEWGVADDGGGSQQYLDFLEVVPTSKKYIKCLEWCAGLSSISFSLLDRKNVEECVLMDIFEEALINAKKNAVSNNISSKINYYVCDEIKKIPKTEKFDLVVANPPHASSSLWHDPSDNVLKEIEGHHRRLVVDKDWTIHREFFENIPLYLLPGADLYISEVDFHYPLLEMAEKNNLKFVTAYPAKELAKVSNPTALIMHFKYET